MAARAPAVRREIKEPGLIARTFAALARLVAALFVALLLSILMEWIGMTVWWPEEGARHSERMLAQELRYLNADFRETVLGIAPVALARTLSAKILELSAFVGLDRLLAWREPDPSIQALQMYLEALVNVMQTFVVRLVVLALAIPVFGLFGLVGMAEGLMRRDLRRWGGGRESSFVYHHSKRFLGPSILSAWTLYLAAPFSIHPNLVLLPFAALFALGVAVTIATFKKYL